MRLLSTLANLCAVLAGGLLTFITLLTCGNLILRNTSGGSLAGAFELTAMASGIAIAAFMPLCQLRRGNIIVDFFTTGLRDATNDALDRVGAMVLATVFLLLAWRTAMGGINAFNAQSQSMLMGIPEWIVYAAMVPPFALTALIGLHQALFKPVDPTGSAA
jgi:TRAP-type C4-dicarboxylate transport system permease small subunit